MKIDRPARLPILLSTHSALVRPDAAQNRWRCPVKAFPVSSSNNQTAAKTVLPQSAPTASPQQSELLSATPRYKPQMETPARSTQNCAAAHFIATH